MGEKKVQYTLADYFAFEADATTKHEYHNGTIQAMSGGTFNHGIIGNNINAEIQQFLKKNRKECVSVNSEVKVYVESVNSVLYPDGMVICGEVNFHEKTNHAVTNPILIVEVLSKSTERYDRAGKFRKYCKLPSFKEYILIDQYKPIVDVLYKVDATYWKMSTVIGLDKSIYLHTLDFNISLRDIYFNVKKLNKPYEE